MEPVIAILFAADNSLYKQIGGLDVYDKARDALTYTGNLPVIAHPPCRLWGVLSHLSTAPSSEKGLALAAVQQVRRCGGVLEHPAYSKLWNATDLPEPGRFPDEHGGFSIRINQYDFGHVCLKPTWLYIVGCELSELPTYNRRLGKPTKRVCGAPRCTKYERSYTPFGMALYLITVCGIIKRKLDI